MLRKSNFLWSRIVAYIKFSLIERYVSGKIKYGWFSGFWIIQKIFSKKKSNQIHLWWDDWKYLTSFDDNWIMLPVSMAVNLRNISDLVILIKFFIFTYQKLILVTTKHAQVAGALAFFWFMNNKWDQRGIWSVNCSSPHFLKSYDLFLLEFVPRISWK